VIALGTVASCGAIPLAHTDVTLRMITGEYGTTGSGSDSATYWARAVSGFERENPGIHVKVDVVAHDEVDDTVTKLVAEGHPPDIALDDSYATFAAADQLYSADDLLTVSQQAAFIPAFAHAGTLGATQYALPWAASSRLLFYNKDLFHAAGIGAAPATWSQLADDARRLKSHGVRVPYGLALGPQDAQAEALMWMLGAGGGFSDTAGDYSFTMPQNVDALTWVTRHLVDTGLVGSADPAKANRDAVFKEFLTRDVGMLFGDPDELRQAEASGINVGLAALPGKDSPAETTLGTADWLMAFRTTGHLAQDAAFMRYVYEDSTIEDFQDTFGLLPVTETAVESVQLLPKDADIRQFLSQLPSARFYPVNKESWSRVGDRVRTSIGASVHNSPERVLDGIEDYAEEQDNASESS
jgi:multiple sugar transport system substrate-binding protein